MDEELLKQQKLLADTLNLAINRLEEASKFYTEKANQLSAAIDTVTVLTEALKHSLSESDTQIDDLAQITAQQMQMYQASQNAES